MPDSPAHPQFSPVKTDCQTRVWTKQKKMLLTLCSEMSQGYIFDMFGYKQTYISKLLLLLLFKARFLPAQYLSHIQFCDLSKFFTTKPTLQVIYTLKYGKPCTISHSDQANVTRTLLLHHFHSPLHSRQPRAFSSLPIKTEEWIPNDCFSHSRWVRHTSSSQRIIKNCMRSSCFN